MRLTAWVLVLTGAAAAGAAQEGNSDPTGSALIDHWVRAKWSDLGMKPAAPADDAEFLRRAYLDVVGVIPSAEEARSFLEDPDPDRRARRVERLVRDPRYADYWADVWNELLLDYDSKGYYQVRSLKGLRGVFAANLPFDEFARRIVTVEGVVNYRNLGGLPTENELAAFVVRERYRSYPFVPQMTASRLTRVFLGVQIQCAQCHDHPFDRWTQEDYLGMVSFFKNLRAVRQKDPGLFHLVGDLGQGPDKQWRIAGRELQRTNHDNPGPIPEKASFLGTGKGIEPGLSRRASFAKHMISENLQFARACVNRYWYHFFGRGIVDPVDDFNQRNKPTHPELLDALARDFIRHGYDLPWLIRAITGSEAYRRTSRQAPRDPAAEKYLATARVRPLTPEQALRSVAQATRLGLKDVAAIAQGRDAGPLPPSLRPAAPTADSMAFKPGSQEFPPEWTAHQNFRYVAGNELSDLTGTITGALLTMNGSVVSAGTALQRRKILDRLLEGGRTPEERIRTVFLSTLTRPPTARELKRWTAHVARGPEHEAYEDLFWTMINTSEFLLNH
jgi:hypothetical protein